MIAWLRGASERPAMTGLTTGAATTVVAPAAAARARRQVSCAPGCSGVPEGDVLARAARPRSSRHASKKRPACTLTNPLGGRLPTGVVRRTTSG